MKTKLIANFIKTLLIAGLLRAMVFSAAADQDYAREISQAHIFPQPLIWVGTNAPDPAETMELWEDAGLDPSKSDVNVVSALEGFLAAHPDSPWMPSLRASLARYYRSQGQYSEALDNWQKAWMATKGSTEPSDRMVADYTVAYWSQLLSSLGRVTELDQLIAEVGSRSLSVPEYQREFTLACQADSVMKRDPGIAYRCGTLALFNAAKASNIKTNFIPLVMMKSPETGFSLAQLMKISDQYHLGFKAVKRPFGGELVVPSVVHWKENHYAAIVGKANGAYQVMDPTFGRPQWLTSKAINENASGYFMVPADAVPDKWQVVSAAQAQTIFGKGVPPNGLGPGPSPPQCPNSGPCDSGTCPTNCPPGGGSGGGSPGGPPGGPPGGGPSGCNNCSAGGGGDGPVGVGMANWEVQEPYISLWLHDRPMVYNMNIGRQFVLQMDYNQRESRPLTVGTYNIFNFGPNWNCNLLTFIQVQGTVVSGIQQVDCGEDTTDTCCTAYVMSGGFQASEYCPDGGESDFSWGGTNSSSTMDIRTHIQMSASDYFNTSSETICGTAETLTNEHFGSTVLNYPNGSVATFGTVITASELPETKIALLTSATDPQGHTMTYNYSTNGDTILLTNVIDFDGKTNFFIYGNTNFPDSVTEITNTAYGLAVKFSYDTNGFLTNITDVIGMNSGFQYIFTNDLFYTNYCTNGLPMDPTTNSLWLLTGLTTPYGVTTFDYFHPSWPLFGATPDADINRAITVTQPDGGKHLFLYSDQGEFDIPPFSFPSEPGGSGDIYDNYQLFWNNIYTGQTLDANFLWEDNSYYWGPRQYSQLSTTVLTNLSQTDYYYLPRIRNWLHSDPDSSFDYSAAPVLNCEQEFSPDPTNQTGNYIGGEPGYVGTTVCYGYEGLYDPGWPFVSTNDDLPCYIGYETSLNGGAQFKNMTRNSLGKILTQVDFGNGEDSDTYIKTNQYVYAANSIDLLEHIAPDGVVNESYAYDSNHDVTALTNALDEVTHYTYNSYQQLTSITQPNGLVTTNIYGGDGFLAQQIVIGYSTNSYTYTNGLVYAHTDERGLTTTNTWDALQRLTKVNYPDGTSISYVYSNLDIVKVIDRLGNVTSSTYDNMDRKVTTTNADNEATHYSYCECGSLENIQDAMGHVTSFTYDSAGRLTNTTYADGYSVMRGYNLVGKLVNTTDSAGYSVQNYYDGELRLIGLTNITYSPHINQSVNTEMAAYAYDIDDRVTNFIDDKGVSVNMSYDNLNRLLTRTYPDGGVESYGYSPDVSGPTSYTNQIGKVWLYSYDALYRKTNDVCAGITTNKFSYNGAGDLLTLTDGKNDATTWNYDQYGRVTNKVDALGTNDFVYEYDDDNRLTNRWTPAKGNTVYGYDAIGDLTGVTYPHSHDISLSYDADNRLTNMVDGTGTTSYSYDDVGELLSEGGLWPEDTVSYTYQNRLRASMSISAPDEATWVQNYAYDEMRRLATLISPAGAFTNWYIGAGEYFSGDYAQCPAGTLLQQIVLPNGDCITNAFDVNARLLSTALQNSGTSLDIQSYAYNEAGERISETNTAGDYRNYTYDNEGELLRVIGQEASGTNRLQEQFGYVYDAAGNLNYRTNNASLGKFSVNAANELTTATNSGSLTVAGATTPAATNVTVNSLTASLYGDATFARAGFTMVSGLNTFTAIAHDGYGRLATNVSSLTISTNNAFTYDANGNLLSDGWRNFVYDDENELIGVWATNAWSNSFAYDGKMRRRIEQDFTWQSGGWVETNEIHFIYDGNVVVQERNANNVPQVTYTWGIDLSGTMQGAGGIGGLLARTDNSKLVIADPFATAFYHADGNGNVTYMIYTNGLQAAKYLYDPYGNTLAMSGFLANANKYRFSSKEWNDNAGLYYYLYRFYNPSLQRWSNRDPKDESGFEILRRNPFYLNIQKGNLYIFVENDPTMQRDVLGLAPEDPGVPGGGSFLGPGLGGGILEIIKTLRVCSQIQPGETVYAVTPASILSYFSAYLLSAGECQCNGGPFIIRTKIYKDAAGNCHWGGPVIICLGSSSPPMS